VIIPGKMHRFAINIAQKRLAAGLRPDPFGNLQRSPRHHSWIKGTRGEGKGGQGTGKEGKGRKGKECEVTGREGKEDAIPSF